MGENLAWLTEKTEESKCNKEGGGRLCGERPDKYFLLSAYVESYMNQVFDFYYLIDMNIQTRNLPMCNFSQYIYITDLCSFLFVPQDLIDRINSYFQRIACQRNLLLIGF